SGDIIASTDWPAIRDYAAIWRAADKIVFSRTLETVRSERTRIERDFDPVAVRALKKDASAPIGIGGPHLAAEAFRPGRVAEYRLTVAPAVIGDGNPAIARDLRLDLTLVDERRFDNGMLSLAYRVAHD